MATNKVAISITFFGFSLSHILPRALLLGLPNYVSYSVKQCEQIDSHELCKYFCFLGQNELL